MSRFRWQALLAFLPCICVNAQTQITGGAFMGSIDGKREIQLVIWWHHGSSEMQGFELERNSRIPRPDIEVG